MRKSAKQDIIDGIFNWELWGRLGWHEIRRRYSRTIIGPFWSTMNLAVFITVVGFVFSNLWGVDIATFLPYLCSGVTTWLLISALITEGCGIFTANNGIIKQFPFPMTVFAIQCVWRNCIVFCHNLVICLIVSLIFSVDLNLNTLLLLPGLALILLNGVSVAIFAGILCARFRDIQPLVVSLLQIMMLITPIFWPPEQVGHWKPIIVDLNILYHFIALVREPLLGNAPSMLNWVVALSVTAFGWAIAYILLEKYRQKIIFWI